MRQNLGLSHRLNNTEWFNTRITGILQAEQENGVDKIFKEMVVENVPNHRIFNPSNSVTPEDNKHLPSTQQ